MPGEIFTFDFEDSVIDVRRPFYSKFAGSIPMHAHSSNSYEIHYIPSGKGVLTIVDCEYTLVPHTVYITGPHIEHKQVPDMTDPMSEYCIYMQIKHDKNKKNSDKNLLEIFESHQFWIGPEMYNTGYIIKQINYELKNTLIGRNAQICIMLQQLMISMVRNYEQDVLKDNNKTDMDYSKTLYDPYLHIDSCFLYNYDSVTLESLSNDIGMSIRQTERLIKSHYGLTFRQKKLAAKMSAAALMLTWDNCRINDISERLGYNSSEHFSAAFKSYYGITPSKYKSNISKQ